MAAPSELGSTDRLVPGPPQLGSALRTPRLGRGPAARRLGLEPGMPGLAVARRVRLVSEIVVAYLTARRALARSPIAEAVARLRQPHPAIAAQAADDALAEARRLGRAVARTLALLPGDTRCLVRSLVLAQLLARRGIPATLVIGARAGPGFLAHAWVEQSGCAVLPPGDGSFGRLVEL